MIAEKLARGAAGLPSVKVATGTVKFTPVVWGAMVAGLRLMGASGRATNETLSRAGPWLVSPGVTSSNSTRVEVEVAVIVTECCAQMRGRPIPATWIVSTTWPPMDTAMSWVCPGVWSPLTADQ